MRWFGRPVNQHQCSPVPIQTKGYECRTYAFEHKTAYKIVTYEYDQCECPVCGKRYPVGDYREVSHKELSYAEMHSLVKYHLKG